jgi:peptide/nickel transport system permease protein
MSAAPVSRSSKVWFVMITAAKLSIIGRRLLQTLPVIVLSTFIVFGLLKLVPGDVAVTLAGDNASEQRIAEIREIYGLDRPFFVQYGTWLWKAAQGDLSN